MAAEVYRKNMRRYLVNKESTRTFKATFIPSRKSFSYIITTSITDVPVTPSWCWASAFAWAGRDKVIRQQNSK